MVKPETEFYIILPKVPIFVSILFRSFFIKTAKKVNTFEK